MSKTRILLVFLSIIIIVQGFNAQTQKPGALWEMLNTIRKEKFDLILPQAMRDNKIDMWIHVMQSVNPDFLALELGGQIEGGRTGYFIFTDRGGDRIERAILGGSGDRELYDIFGSVSDITQFVAERDPKRIGVNFSERFAVSDSISHTDYIKLVKALGAKYAKRMVSADSLITDFISGRVMSQIVLYGQLCIECAEIIEREFDKIEPGVTTLKDLSGNVFLRDPDGNEHNNDDHVIQRGDLITILHGAGNRIFETSIGGIGYVLREGETELPPEVQNIWEHVLITREIFRKNIKVGPTGGETLEILIRKLEEAGYVYIDRDEYDRNLDPEKTQVHIDFHTLFGRMPQVEDYNMPRIVGPKGPDCVRNLKIPLFHTFTFEYMVHMPVPEWGRGKHLYICLHDGVMVTGRGVEFPYPPLKEIRVIR